MKNTVEAPLSWAQERIWFIDRLQGGSSAYNIPFGLRLRGVLDASALRRALDTVLQRHAVLRTVLVEVDGEPKQQIREGVVLQLIEHDLRALTLMARESALRSHKIEEAQGDFDLKHGPLIRGRLLRVADNEHVLLITMHHIVSDGWSMRIFVRELGELYTASVEGRPDDLRPLNFQYADYALRQRGSRQPGSEDANLAYWRKHLARAAPELELPTDRPRPPVQSYRGDFVQISLDAPLCRALSVFARKKGVTLFMALYAAWAVLLSRLSGQEDVIVGSPVTNRPDVDLERMIGLFVNTIVLRLGVSGDLPVDALLEHVRDVALEAYDHQDTPLEHIVEALRPQRDLSRNPLFQVMFSLQKAQSVEAGWPALAVEIEPRVHEASKFDLLMELEEIGEQISGTLHYATDLFDRQTIERWVRCFHVLVNEMPRSEGRRVGELPILTDEDRHQVIEQFNATTVQFAEGTLVHELIEAQAARTPDAPAVAYEDQVITYAELNARANRLAHYLLAKGVAPDRLVGVCLERSPDMVVSLLAILKAGGAYVPLDPSYPPDRLQYIVKSSAPRVVLTHDKWTRALSGSGAELLPLDVLRSEISARDGQNIPASFLRLTPRNLAYVIFTSGSTGNPKGAMNEHLGVVNRLLWMQREYQMNGTDKVLQKTPYSFDVSVWEFFWTLQSGACLVVARPESHKDPSYLTETIERHGITTLHFVPSMLQIFLDHLRPGACRSVRHIVCSGEELPVALQNKCLQSLSGARLSNLYGPTEAAVDVTSWECEPMDQGGRVPIGRPIANCRMYVLNAFGQPVPVGAVGEIHIGGVGVGRGYLNRPELTAERFLRDPFNQPHGRMYRTGDLGRWRSDGAIEYLGRNDHQVKIRGFRIELGEIEAQLIRCAHVREAVVIARGDVTGDKRLVAYVTASSTGLPSAEAMRSALKKVLPEYMVPAAFVVLERLPLSANGKLDRLSLPPPALHAFGTVRYEAPQGEVEETLAGVWCALLGIERVGRNDNFFEIGGHSLLATRVVSRIAALMGVNLPLRAMFDVQTLEALAARVQADREEQGAQDELLARNIRMKIESMHDDAVLAQLRELASQRNA
jgi:arthrofactin-type cyclic lipopeptide synthetase C